MTPKRVASTILFGGLIAITFLQFALGLWYGLAFLGVLSAFASIMYLAICVAKGRWIGLKKIWSVFKEFVDFVWN